MRSRSQIAPARGAGIIAVVLAALLALSFSTSARAEQKGKAADAEFLKKVLPSIAASIDIIKYEVENTSDEHVQEFAGRVLKQHKESFKIAWGHAKRLNIRVIDSGKKESKKMIDKLSNLKGSDLDVAFLECLSDIHHDATLFENEVKNGADPELKTYAENSIDSGNEHLKETQDILALGSDLETDPLYFSRTYWILSVPSRSSLSCVVSIPPA